MPRFTGLSTNTPKRLLLDSGVFLRGAFRTKAAVLAAMQNEETNLGATNGGGSFTATPNYRQAAVDGGITNIKDLITIDDWAITMVANVKAITVKNLELALGAADIDTTTNEGYSTIKGKTDFEVEDYGSITWAGRLKGNDEPVIIIIQNAISLNGITLTVADKDEATIPITLTACYDLADLDAVPFEILYPNDPV